MNQVARENAAAATEPREQISLANRKHAVEIAELKSQLAETRATIATLQKAQDALIAASNRVKIRSLPSKEGT